MPECMCIVCVQCQWTPEGGSAESPRNGVKDGGELPGGCWELSPRSSARAARALTIEPSLQAFSLGFLKQRVSLNLELR